MENLGIGSEEKLVEERKKEIAGFLKARASLIYYGILAVIIWVNVYIRTLPMKINAATGKPGLWDIAADHWTLGPDLDPFLFLRYAKYIVAHGTLMANDMMRNVPLGFNTVNETQILPYLIAYLHKIINFFGEFSVDYAAIILPVIISVFTAVFFFLFVRKIFEEMGEKPSNALALIATAFMVILPAFLARTVAGIPEKESVGFCLMFLSFYLFLSAWKAKNIKNAFIIGALSGISTALMGLVWGGALFVYATIAIAVLVSFILEKIEKKELLVYANWLFFALILCLVAKSRVTVVSFVTSSTSGFGTVILSFIIVYFILFKTKLKDSKILRSQKIERIPRPFLAIIVSFVLLFIASAIIIGPETLTNMGKDILSDLTKPYADRLSFTVAENRQPYFDEWKDSMGPVFRGIPLFFWMFFIGSMMLFYEMIKNLRKKEKILLTSAFTFFLFALIFSRNSESSKLNGANNLSSFVYFLGYIVLFLAACYILYKRYEKNEISELKNIKFNYIFVFSLSFIGIIAARSAVRLIMAFTTIAAIVVAYFIAEIVLRALKSKGEINKILCWVLAAIVVIAAAYTMIAYYQTTKYTATYNIPSSYTHQWQYAMDWVRKNTPENAVFGHWWDYGYWLQSIGERATMLDGGNAIGYWNYLMGRHALTAETEEEALELLYSHNVTHFLIDSTEIGKYSAYSSIGSDEKYDRYSWIGTFFLDEKQIQETKEKIIYIYTGGTAFDEDIMIKENGNNVLLPKEGTGIGALLVYRKTDGSYAQPEAIAVYNSKQYTLPFRYMFIDGKLIDFGIDGNNNTLNACVYIFPEITQNNVDNIGAAMYLSPKNMRALWVKLYLLGEEENFRLVHKEPSEISRYLEGQSIKVSDFVYYQGIQGPIKIWEVKYKGDEKVNPEYLLNDFPERLRSRINR